MPVDAPSATIVPTSNQGSLAAVYMAQHNNDRRRIGGVNPGRPIDEPCSTITQNPQQAVIAASLMSMKGSERRDSAADAPHPAILAGGQHSALIAPHLTKLYSKSDASAADEPAHTISTKAKTGLVAPFLTKYYGTEQDAGVDGPAPTATTRARFGYVHSEIAPEPLTDAQLARARDVADFLRAHGFWDERELVTLTIDGIEFVIIDIGMRMLTPRELFRAQGFPADYIIDLTHEGRTLTKSEQIACCGNSVCPPVAEALVGANCGHLAAVRVAA